MPCRHPLFRRYLQSLLCIMLWIQTNAGDIKAVDNAVVVDSSVGKHHAAGGSVAICHAVAHAIFI